MFRRRVRREERARAEVAEQQGREITELRQRQVELETTLRLVIDASDGLLVDLRRTERELEMARARPGFAEAWMHSEASNPDVDEFFAVSEVDRRARRWLLTSN